jgi:hypothetical protein
MVPPADNNPDNKKADVDVSGIKSEPGKESHKEGTPAAPAKEGKSPEPARH